MKIESLFEALNHTQSAKMLSMDLRSHILQGIKILQDQIAKGIDIEPNKLQAPNMKISRWFNSNSREILSIGGSMKHTPHGKSLLQMKMTANVDKEEGFKTFDNLFIVAEHLPKIAGDDTNNTYQLLQKYDGLKREYKKAVTAADDRRNKQQVKSPKVKKKNNSGQYKQIDDIINHALSSLDPQTAKGIRQQIMKVDYSHKLKKLQSLMS